MFAIGILSLALSAVPADEKIRVVTTIQTYKHVVEKIGGDRVVATALASPKRDPHYIVPDPLMQRIASRADLFVETGRSLELWAVNVRRHSGNPKIQGGDGHLYVATGSSVLEIPQVVSKEWGDIHPEGNPHVWLDPLNVKRIAANIAKALSKVDPAGKAAYAKNLKAFEREIDTAMFGKELVEQEGGSFLWRKERLGKLDAYLKEEKLAEKLGGWAKKARRLRDRNVVSYHKTFAYLSARFGFKVVAELEEKPGIEPSPQRRDRVVEIVRRQRIKVILNEIFYPTRAADYVASETGAKVVVVPIDVGGVEGVNSYVGLLDYILDRMIAALQ